jgi:hypothetical protein
MRFSLNISRAGNQRYPIIADFSKSPTTKLRATLLKPVRGAPAPLWASKNPVLMSPVDPKLDGCFWNQQVDDFMWKVWNGFRHF